MDKYEVTKEEICEVLLEAYEAGWSGYKGMKDHIAAKMTSKFLKGKELVSNKGTKTTPVEFSQSIGLVDPFANAAFLEDAPEVFVEVTGTDGEIVSPDTTLDVWHYSIGDQNARNEESN